MDSPPEADLSTDELFARMLQDCEEDAGAWRAIWQPHHCGGVDVFQRAAAWLQSASPKERGRGANILAQLMDRLSEPHVKIRGEALEDVSLLPVLLAHREAFEEEDDDPEFLPVLHEAIHVLESLSR
ncbi:hypothetical protein [Corallococcus exercitus]|uniref:hypothetical protein n=1 Tax=Corallococcus exercitus TaxID=2316736 RepID=UPI0035D3F026